MLACCLKKGACTLCFPLRPLGPLAFFPVERGRPASASAVDVATMLAVTSFAVHAVSSLVDSPACPVCFPASLLTLSTMKSIRAIALAALMAVLALFLQGCSEEAADTTPVSNETTTAMADSNATTTMATTMMTTTELEANATTMTTTAEENATNSSRLLL